MYLMTLVSREPRQIVGFAVGASANAWQIQQMVDSAPPARKYFADGCRVYQSVDFMGRLRQNYDDKSETHIVEGTNADLRCYVAGLQRRSRCFFRKDETVAAVLWVFINAYNKFGEWKRRRRELNPGCSRHYPNHHIRFI